MRIVKSKQLWHWPNSPNPVKITNGICYTHGFIDINNKAQYKALLVGMRIVSEFEVESLDVFSDSQVVVNQFQGDYLAKNPKMVAYLNKMKSLVNKIKDFRI